jgi:hypothetical protein
MTSRFFAVGIVAALGLITAVSAVGPVQPALMHPNVPGNSPVRIAGGRSPQQRNSEAGSKFDAALADISRHLSRVRPERALADLHALNSAAKFIQPVDSAVPLVSIDATTRGDPQQLKAELVALGLQRASVYSNDVGGWFPVSQLEAAVALGELHGIRAAMSRTRAGAITSQGDFVQNSDLVRSDNALTGAGVTVGIISDSYDCYAVYAANGVPAGGPAGYANNGFTATAAMDMSTGDLPSAVNVLEEAQAGNGGCMNYGAPILLPFGDEGRAMMQIVHDVAPGASLAFYTAENSEADFASGIGKLAAAGAKIIADDVGYFDEPFFQDGIVAQAIDSVEALGVAYFSAAGNNGTFAYDNTAPSFTTVAPPSAPNPGELLLNFDTSNATNTTTLPVTIPPMVPGEFVAIVLEWDQPYLTGCVTPTVQCGANNQLDLCITGAVGNDEIDNGNLTQATCSGANKPGSDPVQVMIVDNPADAAGNSSQETLNIVVGLATGTAPKRIKVAVEADGLPGLAITQFANHGATIQGHPGATGAAAVGAAFFVNTPNCGAASVTLESYSSSGGDPILFDIHGAPIGVPVPRQKPDFVGPDGGNDTFLGFTLAKGGIADNSTVPECKNDANYPNFFGTSAATPHVAGIAALFLQANPTLTPAQIYTALQNSALPMGTPIPNYASGFGFVQANAAAKLFDPVAPPVPTLTLGANSIVVGSSTTITWASANNQGCTATGTWSAQLAANGSQNVSPTAVGSYPYTLACTNNAGTSPTTTVTLTVTAAPPASSGSHSGGGALGLATLLGLGALCLARVRHSLRLRRRGTVTNAQDA